MACKNDRKMEAFISKSDSKTKQRVAFRVSAGQMMVLKPLAVKQWFKKHKDSNK